MRDEKIQKHPPQDSGGYRRRLKEEEAYKGFTLVELIVVIVILAILAAILIPGLLKWIDEAKDKKYELEAREIALAAEGALTKMYAQGAGALDLEAKDGHYLLKAGSSTNLMEYSPFSGELGKFTDATVEKIEIYGNADGGTPGKWGGSATGFEIEFKPSGETESITARLLPGKGRWEFGPFDESGGESGDKFDSDPDPKVREANSVWKAARAAVEQTEGAEYIHHNNGRVRFEPDFSRFDSDLFDVRLYEACSPDVEWVGEAYIWGEKFEVIDGIEEKPWDGNFDRVYLEYRTLDGKYTYAKYYSSTDSWSYYVDPDDATWMAWAEEAFGMVTP